jgi:hypothetical protein
MEQVTADTVLTEPLTSRSAAMHWEFPLDVFPILADNLFVLIPCTSDDPQSCQDNAAVKAIRAIRSYCSIDTAVPEDTRGRMAGTNGEPLAHDRPSNPHEVGQA